MYKNLDGLDPRITNLHTEQRNMDTLNIADASIDEMLKMINREDAKVAQKVEQAIPQISKAVELIADRISRGGRMVYVGAGTSARLAFMDAAECPPTYSTAFDTVSCVMAGGKECVFRAREYMEDVEAEAVKNLKEFGLRALDTVVAAAASGRTPYCVAALAYAKSIGAGSVSIACNSESLMGEYAEVAIEIDTGAEAIMGSTRMKAGTAQKMVMNMLSTAIMIRLGRTYGNLVLGDTAFNSKSSNRSLRVFSEATGNPDLAYAQKRITEAGGSMRCAVVMELTGCDLNTAQRASTAAAGRLKLMFEYAKLMKEGKL